MKEVTMATRNKNWDRWIMGSCAKFFDDFRSDYTLIVEGDIRQTKGLQQWAEFRLDGPYCQEVSKDSWRIDVEINILCLFIPSNEAQYGMHKIVGHFASLFDTIPVYRYGSASEDSDNDGTLLGCLQLRSDVKESMKVSHFGMVTLEGTRLSQANVEGHFRLMLDVF